LYIVKPLLAFSTIFSLLTSEHDNEIVVRKSMVYFNLYILFYYVCPKYILLKTAINQILLKLVYKAKNCCINFILRGLKQSILKPYYKIIIAQERDIIIKW